MALEISQNLAMEDLTLLNGEQINRKDAKARPNNHYCKMITKEEANKIMLSANGDVSARYKDAMKDMEQHDLDYRFECENYDAFTLRQTLIVCKQIFFLHRAK